MRHAREIISLISKLIKTGYFWSDWNTFLISSCSKIVPWFYTKYSLIKKSYRALAIFFLDVAFFIKEMRKVFTYHPDILPSAPSLPWHSALTIYGEKLNGIHWFLYLTLLPPAFWKCTAKIPIALSSRLRNTNSNLVLLSPLFLVVLLPCFLWT